MISLQGRARGSGTGRSGGESGAGKLRERKGKFEALKKTVEKEGEAFTVDPDSKLMRSGGDARKLDVCYNVQTAVDGKHHLIVDFDMAIVRTTRGTC